MEPDEIQDELAQLRELFGFTQQELALILRCNQSTINRLGKGEFTPGDRLVKRLDELIAAVGEVTSSPSVYQQDKKSYRSARLKKIQLQKIRLVKLRSRLVLQIDSLKKEFTQVLVRSQYMESMYHQAKISRNKELRAVFEKVVARNAVALSKYSLHKQLPLELKIAQLDGAIHALDQLMKKKPAPESQLKVKIPVNSRKKQGRKT